MKIQKIISQSRRDFQAIYICEHCNATQEGYGYDDAHFHNNVIPSMECGKCGKQGKKESKPRTPKYYEGQVI